MTLILWKEQSRRGLGVGVLKRIQRKKRADGKTHQWGGPRFAPRTKR